MDLVLSYTLKPQASSDPQLVTSCRQIPGFLGAHEQNQGFFLLFLFFIALISVELTKYESLNSKYRYFITSMAIIDYLWLLLYC